MGLSQFEVNIRHQAGIGDTLDLLGIYILESLVHRLYLKPWAWLITTKEELVDREEARAKD